jgi:hypothetical protein
VNIAYQVVGDAAALLLMPDDSKTRLKGQPIGRKRVAWCPPVPLDEVKAVGLSLNCSIRTVLLSCVAGAIGQYLRDLGDDPRGQEIRAMVPVNLRPVHEAHKLGNRFGLAPVVLLTSRARPLQARLQRELRFAAIAVSDVISMAVGVAAAIAAELGTMRVTEQIDAMESMAVSPIQYLVVPRVIAALVMFPMLTMLFNALGYAGAYVMGIYVAGIPEGPFIQHTKEFIGPDDIFHGLWKALVFGAIVAVITTWRGYSARGGARGVGEGTTRAVVASSIAVLIADYAATVLSVGS